jgi:hypothetical protein
MSYFKLIIAFIIHICISQANKPKLSLTSELMIQEASDKFLRKNVTALINSEPTSLFMPNKGFCTCQKTTTFTENLSNEHRVFTVNSESDTEVFVIASVREYEGISSISYLYRFWQKFSFKN